MPVRVTHLLVLGLLVSLALTMYWPIFLIQPLRGDNFYILAWADSASGSDLWALDPAIYPEWRPLPFQWIWLEHQLVQLRAVAIHHGVNLALWITCAWLVYRIVERLTGSRFAGALAGVVLVSDPRSLQLMTWIVDRQTSMACAFGLFGLYLLAGARDRDLTRREGAMVMGSLLGAALSKEYGLAFVGAFLLYGAWRRSPDTLWAAGAAACYVLARVVFAGGAVATYCEDMGFLGVLSQHCVDPLAPAAAWPQMVYNVAAALVATPIHGVFDNYGRVSFDWPWVYATGALALVSLVGLIRGPRVTWAAALVIVGNSLLAFMIYRPRNLMIGECALAILTGVGIAYTPTLLAGARARLAVLIAVTALTTIVVGKQVVRTQERVTHEVDELLNADPCDSQFRMRTFGEPFVEKVKRRFEMDDPTCAGAP